LDGGIGIYINNNRTLNGSASYLGLSSKTTGGQTDSSYIANVAGTGSSTNIVGAGMAFGMRVTALTSTYQEMMRITSDGNVGIGTATPAAKLHVNGSVRIEGATTNVGPLIVQGGGNVATNGGATLTAGADIGLSSTVISNGANITISYTGAGSSGGVSAATATGISFAVVGEWAATGTANKATTATTVTGAQSNRIEAALTNAGAFATAAQGIAATNAQQRIGVVETNYVSLGVYNAGTNQAVVTATQRVAAVGYLLPASTQGLATVTQLGTATNAAIIAATNRVAGVGYLLPVSTQGLATVAQVTAATNGIDASFIASKGGVTNAAAFVATNDTRYLAALSPWDAPRSFIGSTGTLWAFGDSQTLGINDAVKWYTSGGYLLPQYRWPNMLATNFDRSLSVSNMAVSGERISGMGRSQYNMMGWLWTNWNGVAVCMNAWNNLDQNTTTEAFYTVLAGSHAACIGRLLIDDYAGVSYLGAGSRGLSAGYPLYGWETDGANGNETTPAAGMGQSINPFYYGDTNGIRYRTNLTGTNHLSFALTNKQAVALFVETSSDGGPYHVSVNGTRVFSGSSAYTNIGGNDSGQYAQVIWLENAPTNSLVKLDANCGTGHVYFSSFGWVDKGSTKLKQKAVIYGTPLGNTANQHAATTLKRAGKAAENAVGAFARLGYPTRMADTFSAFRVSTDQEPTDTYHLTDIGNYHVRDAFERSLSVNGRLENVLELGGTAGANGANGVNAYVAITNVVTLAAGASAWASNSIAGATNSITLGIPQGAKGDDGTGGGASSSNSILLYVVGEKWIPVLPTEIAPSNVLYFSATHQTETGKWRLVVPGESL
jgi:hypothetical protein